MKIEKSKFDSSHRVIYVEKDNENYSKLKLHFKKHGLAFKQGNFIFFDMPSIRKNNYGEDHLTFIEAHEIAHSVLNHAKSSRHIEAEADYLAILLCKDMNFTKAYKLGHSHFKGRNKISFESFQKKFGKEIISRI